MPVYKSSTVLKVARNVKAFLELNAGLVRGEVPDPEQAHRKLKQTHVHVEQLQKQLAERNRQLQQARKQLTARNRQLQSWRKRSSKPDTEAGGIRAENMVWMFGYGRTGSSWLAAMMNEMKDQTRWHEPFVGLLFGAFYYNWVGEEHFKSPHFILGPPRESWVKSLRSFILDQASAKFPQVANGGYLVVKEPNGSVGAPLLMEALPESRMILLIRDPRDVTASRLDAFKEGSWLYKSVVEEGSGRTTMFDMQKNTLVENTANEYLQHVGNAREAYEAHEGPKVLVKYEDLRTDTVGEMKRLYSALDVRVDEGELRRVVEKYSWERIPAEEKGEGKFYRKAAIGSWSEELTPEQIDTVERVTAPLIKAFYP